MIKQGSPGRLLASGREADVYEWDEGRVLRRYRGERDTSREVMLMVHLAGHGFPVPAVYHAAGPDLVLERLDGPTLLEALLRGETTAADAGAVLADLHRRLRTVPAATSADPVDRIRHLDLHFGNVILSPRGPVLIDWPNGDEGPPDLDLALSALIIAEAACGSYIPVRFADTARDALPTLLASAGGDPLPYLDQAVANRANMPTLSPEEKARLAPAAELVRAVAEAVRDGDPAPA